VRRFSAALILALSKAGEKEDGERSERSGDPFASPPGGGSVRQWANPPVGATYRLTSESAYRRDLLAEERRTEDGKIWSAALQRRFDSGPFKSWRKRGRRPVGARHAVPGKEPRCKQHHNSSWWKK